MTTSLKLVQFIHKTPRNSRRFTAPHFTLTHAWSQSYSRRIPFRLDKEQGLRTPRNPGSTSRHLEEPRDPRRSKSSLLRLEVFYRIDTNTTGNYAQIAEISRVCGNTCPGGIVFTYFSDPVPPYNVLYMKGLRRAMNSLHALQRCKHYSDSCMTAMLRSRTRDRHILKHIGSDEP